MENETNDKQTQIKMKTNTLITAQRYKFSHRLITIWVLIFVQHRTAGCRWIFTSTFHINAWVEL